MVFWQQLFAVITVVVAVLAYAARGEWPFTEPISFLYGGGPGSWGYHAVLTGCTAVLLAGMHRAKCESNLLSCLIHGLALLPVAVLVLRPNGQPGHDGAAMVLGAAGLLWMFDRSLTATVIWRRCAPWIGLIGVVLMASAKWAAGEAFLMVGMVIAAGAMPVAVLQLPSVIPTIPWTRPDRMFEVGIPGLGWGIVLLVVVNLGGDLRGYVLPPLVLAIGWSAGWVLTRWDPGLLLSISLRIVPVMLLLHAVGTSGGSLCLMLLLAGGLVIMRMMRVLIEE